MFDSHKTKEICQLVIRVGSFVKTCLHAMAIAEHLARDVEKSKDENDPLKAAFLKFKYPIKIVHNVAGSRGMRTNFGKSYGNDL
ncbi:unnamed protein product [Caenorhabditis nigoni]